MNILDAWKLWRQIKELNKKGAEMLQGYKTYIVILLQAIYDVLAASGVVLPDSLTQDNVMIAVNVIAAALATVFNYVGRKRLEAK